MGCCNSRACPPPPACRISAPRDKAGPRGRAGKLTASFRVPLHVLPHSHHRRPMEAPPAARARLTGPAAHPRPGARDPVQLAGPGPFRLALPGPLRWLRGPGLRGRLARGRPRADGRTEPRHRPWPERQRPAARGRGLHRGRPRRRCPLA